MDTLWKLFPHDNFVLLGFILLLPLTGAFVNGVFGKRLGRQAVSLMGLTAVGVPFLMSLVAFAMLRAQSAEGEGHVRLLWNAWSWMNLSAIGRGSSGLAEVPVNISVAFSLDALSGTMALVITGVGFLIHLYSTKYMEHDPGYHRFFCYLNLFIFSMLVLILGDNLPVLFVGWEGVGLCSYLLIGFWFSDTKNAQAGKKAFITNRIGDFGLLVAMGFILHHTGALDWTGIDANRHALLTEHQVWPLVGNRIWFTQYLPVGLANALNDPVTVSGATLVGLALFLGCAGKSAQLPLYVWLPDAMAGPTPVSALIHAATMVTAGIYLVCRMSSVFVLSPDAMMVMAVVGALTAFLAASIAFAQKDIKKILAYSTVSQLGYMFMAVGVGAFAAGFFHVMTHAFFKACLFLGAGSVIHAMHARIHDSDASQDMRNMGGLRQFLPITFATFAISWAAIIGVPGTSGFFSKDEIIFKTFTSYVVSSGGDADWARGVSLFVFTLALMGAVMTAFYMTRMFIGTFFGQFKGWTIVQGAPGHSSLSAHGEHGSAHAGGASHAEPADAHHGGATDAGPLKGPAPHESPWQMTLPLVILAGLALTTGFLNAGPLGIHVLEHWLEPVFEPALSSVKSIEGAEGLVIPLLAPGIVAMALGLGAAYWVYAVQRGEPAEQFKANFPRFHALVYDKWRVDELYQETVIGAVETLAEIAVWIDKYIVDGIVARTTAALVAFSGYVLRQFQTGRVQTYSAVMVVGLLCVGWHFVTPHADITPRLDIAQGQRLLSAPQGFGYAYRWDRDGDGQWDAGGRTLTLPIENGPARVRLQVTNIFGWTSERTLDLTKSEASPLTAQLFNGGPDQRKVTP